MTSFTPPFSPQSGENGGAQKNYTDDGCISGGLSHTIQHGETPKKKLEELYV
jgi:hypothetical protein